MGMHKISIEGASRYYSDGNVTVFQDLDLSIRENEVLCIVGPSGCGKTTLLRCIDGLIPLSSGRITIDGKLVKKPRTDVAMVFQHFGLFPWKSVYDNIAYGLALQGKGRGEIKDSVERYVRMVGLEGFARSYPYQLSGGMQQRAGLARALAVDPQVLLMDEPFASLDAQTREVLQDQLLAILETEKKTMVFITHSIDEAIALGNRIAVLTHRPARVREIMTLNFDGKRTVESVKAHPQFGELRNHIWHQLRREIT